jgi:hypothetical protein
VANTILRMANSFASMCASDVSGLADYCLLDLDKRTGRAKLFFTCESILICREINQVIPSATVPTRPSAHSF